MKNKLKLLFAFLSLSVSVFAQTPNISSAPAPEQKGSSVLGPTVNNGLYIPEHLPNRKPIPYTPLRQADVTWQKRIWRVVDLREKINHPLYYPINDIAKRPSLYSVIQRGVAAHELSTFDPGPAVFDSDEEFKTEFTFEQSMKAFTKETSFLKPDSITGEMISVTVPDTIKPDDVKQYWIKEDWFFDKQRSVMDVRILGLAPVVESTDDKGEFKGYKCLFWLYYPGCRNWFSKFECYNPYNDAEWRSYDEIIQKRQFNSYIYQESNVFNRKIVQEAAGIDQLLKSEEIKDNIFKFEHDMWHF